LAPERREPRNEVRTCEEQCPDQSGWQDGAAGMVPDDPPRQEAEKLLKQTSRT